MEIRKQNHTAYRLMYHIVWIPKYRHKLLVKGVDRYCEEIIKSIQKERYPDVEINEIEVKEDHIHIVMIIPPKYAISRVMKELKSRSSRGMRKKYEYIRRGRENLWSIGYFVSSIGLDEKKIRWYVRHQEEQDKGQTKFVIE